MRVLLVDNNIDEISALRGEIEKHFLVDVAHNGSEGAYLSQVNDYSAIVIDSILGDMSGADLCKSARDSEVIAPIIVTTNGDDVETQLAVLENGADLVFNKTLTPTLLVANIKSLTRRTYFFVDRPRIECADLVIDLNTRKIFRGDCEIYLRRREFDLLEALTINKNNAVSKEYLLEQVWEDGIETASNTLEVHIRNLRLKIDKPFGRKNIITVHGFGYKLALK